MVGSLSDDMKDVIVCPCWRGRITEMFGLQHSKMCIRQIVKVRPVKGENVVNFYPV